MSDNDKIHEYLEATKKQGNKMILGVVLASLVFLIPLIIIVATDMWTPFGGPEAGMKWLIAASACLGVLYATLIFDKLYRNY